MTHAPAPAPTTWHAGLARRDITAWEPNMAMLGWGDPKHRVQGVTFPLSARALVLRRPDHGEQLAFVTLDLCFIPQLLRATVVDALAADGFGPEQVVLLASHTHAGPSGINDAVLYGAMNFGLSPGVFDVIAEGAIDAVRAARHAAEPCVVRLGRAEAPANLPIFFHRSLGAWRLNPEATADATTTTAPSRQLRALRIDTPDGRPLGRVIHAATHATVIHSDHPFLDADWPGRAAATLDQLGGTTLIFQGGAGDVTANHRWDPVRRLVVGADDRDTDSAARVAAAVAEVATAALEDARQHPALSGSLRGRLRHVDLRNAEVDATFLPRRHRGSPFTRPARLGLAMPMGTHEGPGPLHVVRPLIDAMHRARHRRPDPGLPFGELEVGFRGRLFGFFPAPWLRPLHGVDPVLDWLLTNLRAGLPIDRPWVPPILPIQLLQVGPLSLPTLPFEPTTVAAHRIGRLLADHGAIETLTLGYANAYAGYLTTPEEYAAQSYEGGHTLYGPLSLGAVLTTLRELTRPGTGVAGPSPALVPRSILLREREVGRAGIHPRFRALFADQAHGDVRRA